MRDSAGDNGEAAGAEDAGIGAVEYQRAGGGANTHAAIRTLRLHALTVI